MSGWRRETVVEIGRYLVGGGSLTLLTHGLYLVGLALGLAPSVAWAVAYGFGVMLGYVVHRRFVFRAPAQRHHWFSFPASYGLRFVIGEGLLAGFLRLGLAPGWAGFATNLVMAPIGFLLLRFVLRGRRLSPTATVSAD